MAYWWIVNTNTEQMIGCFDDDGKANCSIGSDQQWLEVPEGVAPGNAKVLNTEGVLSLVDGSADKAGPKWDAMRAERNTKLQSCDWTQLADSPLDAPAQESWATYRQTLRDLPENTIDPEDVTWPEEP